jgi:hypothetical protein
VSNTIPQTLAAALRAAGTDGMGLRDAFELARPNVLNDFIPEVDSEGRRCWSGKLPFSSYVPTVWAWARELARDGHVELRARRLVPGDPWHRLDKMMFAELRPEFPSANEARIGKETYMVRMFAAVGSSPRQKPDQSVVNEWLLNRATAEGRRLKYNTDADIRVECAAETGASVRQIKAAFQVLPDDYRYTRGKPSRKSNVRFKAFDVSFCRSA